MIKNVLLIDSEGGHGGSSKSMFTLVKYMNRKKLNLKILCKKESWIKQEYKNKGISCSILSFIPTYTVLDTVAKNIYSLFFFVFYRLLIFFF